LEGIAEDERRGVASSMAQWREEDKDEDEDEDEEGGTGARQIKLDRQFRFAMGFAGKRPRPVPRRSAVLQPPGASASR